MEAETTIVDTEEGGCSSSQHNNHHQQHLEQSKNTNDKNTADVVVDPPPPRIPSTTTRDTIVASIFDRKYRISRKEANFVIIWGGLCSFNTGMLNGCVASGIISNDGRTEIIAGLTGPYTNAALQLAQGNITGYPSWAYYSGVILCYGSGAFIAATISPNARPYLLEPSYGPTLFIGGIFIVLGALAVHIGLDYTWTIYLAAAATGIKNGVMSLYSENLVRVAPTGATLDVFLALGQFRSNRKGFWKALVLSIILIMFWLGALAAYYGALRFRDEILLFNAGAYVLEAFLLVGFLVRNFSLRLWQAISGCWQHPDRTPASSSINNEDRYSRPAIHHALMEVFDQRASAANESTTNSISENIQVDIDELFHDVMTASTRIGRPVPMNREQMKIILERLDEELTEGKVNREDWERIVDIALDCKIFMPTHKESTTPNKAIRP